MKWYEYRNMRTLETIWWTQRDANGICWEIRRTQLSTRFRLYKCDDYIATFDTLNKAINAAQ